MTAYQTCGGVFNVDLAGSDDNFLLLQGCLNVINTINTHGTVEWSVILFS